jgi:hypothetical protein
MKIRIYKCVMNVLVANSLVFMTLIVVEHDEILPPCGGKAKRCFEGDGGWQHRRAGRQVCVHRRKSVRSREICIKEESTYIEKRYKKD